MMDARVSSIVARIEASGSPCEEASDCPWLESIEASFGRRLPEPYRSLLRYFRFPEFELLGFESFSNFGDGSDNDIAVAPFKDRALREWLVPRGFIHIGRPSTGSYDPICFDLARETKEPKIVRFDHEDILLVRAQIEPVVVAGSFMELVGANAT